MSAPIPGRLHQLASAMHTWDPSVVGQDFVARMKAGPPTQADYDAIVAKQKDMNRGTWFVSPYAPADPHQATRLGMAEHLRAIRLEMEAYPDIKAAGFRGIFNALF